MSDNCELKWQPTKDQLDNMILPAYTDMAKQSVAYVNKFGCPPEYVADMLRDIADALTSIPVSYTHLTLPTNREV